MKITKCSRVQTLKIADLSERTGVKVRKLVPVIMHHGLMKLKEGADIFECEEVKVAYMQPSLKTGFDVLHAQTGEKLSILYANALNYGIEHLNRQVNEIKESVFVRFG